MTSMALSRPPMSAAPVGVGDAGRDAVPAVRVSLASTAVTETHADDGPVVVDRSLAHQRRVS
jgi:hypothetical protein